MRDLRFGRHLRYRDFWKPITSREKISTRIHLRGPDTAA